jgi:hypothetical protein
MLQVRHSSHVPGHGSYVVVNVTTAEVIFGPATFSECVQVVEKDRASDDDLGYAEGQKDTMAFDASTQIDSYHPSRGDYLSD